MKLGITFIELCQQFGHVRPNGPGVDLIIMVKILNRKKGKEIPNIAFLIFVNREFDNVSSSDLCE